MMKFFIMTLILFLPILATYSLVYISLDTHIFRLFNKSIELSKKYRKNWTKKLEKFINLYELSISLFIFCSIVAGIIASITKFSALFFFPFILGTTLDSLSTYYGLRNKDFIYRKTGRLYCEINPLFFYLNFIKNKKILRALCIILDLIILYLFYFIAIIDITYALLAFFAGIMRMLVAASNLLKPSYLLIFRSRS